MIIQFTPVQVVFRVGLALCVLGTIGFLTYMTKGQEWRAVVLLSIASLYVGAVMSFGVACLCGSTKREVKPLKAGKSEDKKVE